MHVVLEEPFAASQKSYVQTAINLHMEDVDRSSEADSSYFDDWVHINTIKHARPSKPRVLMRMY